MTKHINFSEEVNALDSLERSFDFLLKVNKQPRYWKWVVISLFLSLYGFLICCLRGTNPDRVKRRDGKLIGFPEALKRAQDIKYMQMTTQSTVLNISSNQKKSIQMLHETFRNQFEHYEPLLWTIEISGFPIMAKNVLDVIKFVALNTGNYTHLSNSQKRKIRSLIYQSNKLL